MCVGFDLEQSGACISHGCFKNRKNGKARISIVLYKFKHVTPIQFCLRTLPRLQSMLNFLYKNVSSGGHTVFRDTQCVMFSLHK